MASDANPSDAKAERSAAQRLSPTLHRPTTAPPQMAAEDAALRAAEAARDAEGARRACRFRLVLLTGDLAKGLTGEGGLTRCRCLLHACPAPSARHPPGPYLTPCPDPAVSPAAGRAKFASCVTGLALGHRHIHMLGPEHGLQRVAAPGAQLVAENARWAKGGGGGGGRERASTCYFLGGSQTVMLAKHANVPWQAHRGNNAELQGLARIVVGLYTCLEV